MVKPLFDELDCMWKNRELAQGQLEKFCLTQEDLAVLSTEIRSGLVSSILLYELFATMRKRYSLDDMDASCAGILLCKTMESLLVESLFDKLVDLFPEANAGNKKLNKVERKKATVGVFTSVLRNEECISQLASRQLSLYEQVCDDAWWKECCGQAFL